MKQIKSVSKKNMRGEIIRFLILAVIVLIFLYPFAFMILKSLDEMANYGLKVPPSLIPEKFGFKNYITSVKIVPIFTYYMNTIYITLWAVFVHLTTSVMAGYAISKGKLRKKNLWLIFILSTMMIPGEAILLTRFLMFKDLGLVNTYLGLILPTLSYPFGVFLSKQYFDGLPSSLGEAAKIDGANEWQIFTRIYIPLTKPVLATLTILTVMEEWNSLMWPLLILTKSKMFTISLGIAFFSIGELNRPIVGNSLAVATMAIFPVIIVFLFLQKYIIQSIAVSGLKQ